MSVPKRVRRSCALPPDAAGAIRRDRSRCQQGTALDPGKFVPHGLANDCGIVVGLAAKPPAIAQSEVPAQPQIRICRDRALSSDDVADSLGRDSDVLREAVLRKAKWLQELFLQHFSGRNRGNRTHAQFPSVVIDDFNVFGSVRGPNETYAPLIVDAYAVLPLPLALQRLQMIAGRHTQVIQNRRPVELFKLSKGRPLDADPTTDTSPQKQGLRVLALEAFDRHSKY